MQVTYPGTNVRSGTSREREVNIGFSGGRETLPPLTIGGPVPKLLHELETNIHPWFNPNQGWKLRGWRLGLLDPQQIHEALNNPSRTTSEIAPEVLTISLTYRADSPPVSRGLFGGDPRLDMKRVFSSEFPGIIRTTESSRLDLYPQKIGTLYPIDLALKKLANEFYLSFVTAHPTYENPPMFTLTQRGDIRELPTDVTIMAVLKNLLSHIKREEMRFRALKEEMIRRYGVREITPAEQISDPVQRFFTQAEPYRPTIEDAFKRFS